MSIGLLALAALAVMAIGAGGAAATQVLPAATNIEAKSTETLFLPENAYGELFVRCTSSTARFTTPPAGGINQNVNSAGVGTRSGGSGGVWADLSEPPSFSGCDLLKGGTPLEEATVKTNALNGAWSLTANGISESSGSGAIGVPKAGATITVGATTLTISPEEASAVFAPEYDNATHTLRVDSQIRFSPSSAPLISPAQFEGEYEANNNLRILP